ELRLERGLGDTPNGLTELLRAGIRQEVDLVLRQDAPGGGLVVVALERGQVVVREHGVDIRQGRPTLNAVDDLDLEVLVLKERTNHLGRGEHGARTTTGVLVLVQIGSVDQVREQLGGVIREQLRQSEGQLRI